MYDNIRIIIFLGIIISGYWLTGRYFRLTVQKRLIISFIIAIIISASFYKISLTESERKDKEEASIKEKRDSEEKAKEIENKHIIATNKTSKIASMIQSNVNTGGYNGCKCEAIAAELVRCGMYFGAGTNTESVEASVKGVAELFAQSARLASTIYYIGYSGEQKVCEYKYNMFDATVSKSN